MKTFRNHQMNRNAFSKLEDRQPDKTEKHMHCACMTNKNDIVTVKETRHGPYTKNRLPDRHTCSGYS